MSKDLPKGLNESQAEEWFIANQGRLPEWWLDPFQRQAALGADMTSVTNEAHLNQFEQAYGDETRQGDRASAVGDLRNIAGQGMPGEKKWRRWRRGG